MDATINNEMVEEAAEKNEELVEVAMQIILHAGDARNIADEAFKCAKRFEFEAAEQKMAEAEAEQVLAHRAQTDVIVNETQGHKYDHSLLFAHAQDTMMTVQTELRTTRQMIEILKIVSER